MEAATLPIRRQALNGAKRATSDRSGLRVCMIHYSDFEIDSRLQRQARALAERGDEVESICLSDPATIKVGNGVIRLHGVPRKQRRGGPAAYLTDYGAFFASAMTRLAALDGMRRFDLIEVHNMPNFLSFAALRAKLRGTPVILNQHDTFPELFATKYGLEMGHPLVRLIKMEERWSTRVADALVTVTEEAKRELNARGVGRGKTTVVMNAPDQRFFGPPREPVTVPDSGPVRIVYHGGTAPRFGVETVVRAMPLIAERRPEARLRVYGSFKHDDSVRELAARVLPGRIYVAPKPVPVKRIGRKIAECHVGVVPTLHDVFTRLLLPVKLLEYVHLGIPVVSARLPAIERYFSEDEIWYFDPGSSESLAEAVGAVLADPPEAARRAARAAERLKGFEWDRQRATYLAMIDDLVSVGKQLPAPVAA